MCSSTVAGSPTPPPPDEPPADLPSRYVLLESLGQGGMGSVHTAYDRLLDRKVALKVLHAAHDDSARERFMREAQALARLSHPNIVKVFDVGSVSERPFLTMELVEGQSLRHWLRVPRTWLEIVRAYLAAGRGLAAAHDAGLVHRDVKPANILVGTDGTVRVADFGVAHMPGSPAEPGMALGTPRYMMAPEQADGAAPDPRADQYSLCGSLKEALEELRPPAHIRRAVERGIEGAPAARFRSMAALLRALDPEPRRQRRRAVIAVAVTCLTVGGVLAVRPAHDPVTSCRASAAAKLAGAWDAPRRAKVRAALLGTGRPYAAHVAATVERALDGYGASWSAAHADVCRGAETVAMGSLRMACLTRRRDELAAATAMLARAPDLEVLDRSLAQAGQLTPIDDTRALAAAIRPPESPELAARVAELRGRLDAARAMNVAGRGRRALPEVADITVRASQVPYAPLQAEALLLLGQLQEGAGQYAAAEATLRRGAAAAARAGDDNRQAHAWFMLYRILGLRQGRFTEASTLLAAAEAALVRAGEPPLERAFLSGVQGVVELNARQIQPGLVHVLVAFTLCATLRPDGLEVLSSLGYLAFGLQSDGRYDDARRILEQELALSKRLIGEHHPTAINILGNMGIVAHAQGRDTEALAFRERSLALAETVLGPEHADVALHRRTVANLLTDRHRARDAVPLYRRVLAAQLATLGPRNVQVAITRADLGQALGFLGETAAARQELEQALAVQEANKDEGAQGTTLATLGVVLLSVDAAESAQVLERAIALSEKVLRPGHPQLAERRVYLASALTALGKLDRAESLLAQAHAIVDAEPSGRAIRAHAHPIEAELAARRGRGAEARENLGVHQAHRRGARSATRPGNGLPLVSSAWYHFTPANPGGIQ